jgi:hypothetical protein
MKDLQTKKKQNSKNKDEISDIEHDNEDMLTLGSVSFKKPLEDIPEAGTKCYVASTSQYPGTILIYWKHTFINMKFLGFRLLHLNPEDAIAHAKALIYMIK